MADSDNTFSGADVPVVAAFGAGRLHATQQTTAVTTGDIDSPPLELRNGAVAADVLTLRLAAEKIHEVSGSDVVVPEIAGGSSPVLESLARVTYNPANLSATATIDTGMLRWQQPAQEDSFTDYSGHTKQAAKLGRDKVAVIDGSPVSNGTMLLADGRELKLWFAAVDKDAQPTRYGLVEKASSFMAEFGNAQKMDAKRVIPAAQVSWKDTMPEIVAANPGLLERAEQTVRFAVDYTGARAMASTTLTMRSIDMTPTVVFGDKGPIMYWLSEVDGDVPFAVTQSTPEAWLEVGQRPDFDFKGNQPLAQTELPEL